MIDWASIPGGFRVVAGSSWSHSSSGGPNQPRRESFRSDQKLAVSRNDCFALAGCYCAQNLAHSFGSAHDKPSWYRIAGSGVKGSLLVDTADITVDESRTDESHL